MSIPAPVTTSLRSVAALVVFALATLPAQRVVRVHLGDQIGDRLGATVGATADLDGDGLRDYFAAAPADERGVRVGYVRAYSARDGHTLFTTGSGSLYEGFASAACGIGDLDGDGTADLLVGVPERTGVGRRGEVVACSGRSGFPFRSYSVAGKYRFGAIVQALGDIDGDRVDDFVTVAFDNREVLVLSGASGIVLRSARGGGAGSGRIGSLAIAGDVDGDGFPDYIAGDPNTLSNQGEVWVWSGRSGTQLRYYTVADQSLFGTSVGAAGDADGDGRDDFLVGSENAVDPASGFRTGSVTLYSGRTGAVLRQVFGAPASSRLGRVVAGVGDVNLDGHDDFAVAGVSSAGYVQIRSGRTGEVLTELRGVRGVGSYGDALARIGDLDGDGRDDLLIGAPRDYAPWYEQGSLHVVSSRITAATGVRATDCGGGPFLPELGATRPILGQVATIAGRDAPAGSSGVLLVGAPLEPALDLGVPGCDLFVDVGGAVAIALPATASWTLPVALPAIDPLAGMHFALQAVYGPTAGVLGFDLSNALVWRLGH